MFCLYAIIHTLKPSCRYDTSRCWTLVSFISFVFFLLSFSCCCAKPFFMLSHSNHIECIVGKTESKGSFNFASWFPAFCVGGSVCDTQIHVQNQVRIKKKIPVQNFSLVFAFIDEQTFAFTRMHATHNHSK